MKGDRAAHSDVQAVIQTVDAIPLYTDLMRWEEVEAAFADEVSLDYTDLQGGEPQQVTPQQIVEAWGAVFPGFESTQHLVTNHQVEVTEDEATVLAQVHATHFLPDDEGDTWVVAGRYHFHLTRQGTWRVDAMRLELAFQLGNTALGQRAAERATENRLL